MSTFEVFAERLKDLIEIEEYNNSTLAKKLGVHRKTVGHWFLGHHLPKISTLLKIVQNFNVSSDYLLGEENQENLCISKVPEIGQVRNIFATNIEEYLKQNKITDHAFSVQLKVRNIVVTNWRTGKSLPECETLKKVSQITGITIDQLLGIE